MRSTLYALLISVFLLTQPSHLHAQDALRQIIERAIRAQGGEAKVAKLKAMRIRVSGTGNFVPGRPSIPLTLEDTWQMPDQYKSVLRMELDGKPFVQIQIVDSSEGWLTVNGQTRPLPPDALIEFREQKYAEDLDRLLILQNGGFKLSAAEDIKIEGRPAWGITVSSQGHRNVTLYFDKTTGLLAKRVQQILGDDGKLVSQEVLFKDYSKKNGLKHWMRIEAHRNGSKLLEARVTQLEFFEKIDDREFAKP